MALENSSTTSSEKETLDFMNVESFSQLPFIRPHAAATAFANSNSKEKPIRLFGIEFGINSSEAPDAAGGGGDAWSADEKNNAEETSAHVKEDESSSNNDNNNNRRFECHYCCRNFPTSQALGGHQNAHKRERQHAKRAHLADAHHIYGLMNYTARLGSGPNNITDYPSWTSSNTPGRTRFYGTHHHHLHHQSSNYSQAQAPINGSPLGLWRIPGAASSSASAVHSHHASFNRDRSILQQQESPLPLFGSSSQDHQIVVGGSKSSLLTQSSSSGFAFHETKPGSYDHVSLDLHL